MSYFFHNLVFEVIHFRKQFVRGPYLEDGMDFYEYVDKLHYKMGLVPENLFSPVLGILIPIPLILLYKFLNWVYGIQPTMVYDHSIKSKCFYSFFTRGKVRIRRKIKLLIDFTDMKIGYSIDKKRFFKALLYISIVNPLIYVFYAIPREVMAFLFLYAVIPVYQYIVIKIFFKGAFWLLVIRGQIQRLVYGSGLDEEEYYMFANPSKDFVKVEDPYDDPFFYEREVMDDMDEPLDFFSPGVPFIGVGVLMSAISFIVYSVARLKTTLQKLKVVYLKWINTYYMSVPEDEWEAALSSKYIFMYTWLISLFLLTALFFLWSPFKDLATSFEDSTDEEGDDFDASLVLYMLAFFFEYYSEFYFFGESQLQKYAEYYIMYQPLADLWKLLGWGEYPILSPETFELIDNEEGDFLVDEHINHVNFNIKINPDYYRMLMSGNYVYEYGWHVAHWYKLVPAFRQEMYMPGYFDGIQAKLRRQDMVLDERFYEDDTNSMATLWHMYYWYYQEFDELYVS